MVGRKELSLFTRLTDKTQPGLHGKNRCTSACRFNTMAAVEATAFSLERKSMTQRQPYSVLVVIYNQSHEFLLLQRSDDPLFWQSVTGGIDQGETPLQTAYRELKEETGIDAKALGLEIVAHDHVNHYEIRPEWRHRYSANDYINTEYVFSIQVPNATLVTLNPNEHLNYCWLDAQQALDKVWSASNRDEIAALAQLFQPS